MKPLGISGRKLAAPSHKEPNKNLILSRGHGDTGPSEQMHFPASLRLRESIMSLVLFPA